MMTDKVDKREQLSALMDGQLNEQESQNILNALLNDAELKATWKELCHVRSVYQNKLDDKLLKGDISGNVSAILENEPSHFVETAVQLDKPQTHKIDWHNRSILFKSGVGVAIAASVMFLTLNISQLLTQPSTNSSQPGQQMADAKHDSQGTIPPAYVASKLSGSVPMPFAQTATFSQFDNISSQTVSSSNFLSLENKKQYPLSPDKVIDLRAMHETDELNQSDSQVLPKKTN